MNKSLSLLLAGGVALGAALASPNLHAANFAIASHPNRTFEKNGIADSDANWNTKVARLQQLGAKTIRVEFPYKNPADSDWNTYVNTRMDVYNRFDGAGLGGEPAAGIELMGLFTFYGGSPAYGGAGSRPTTNQFQTFVTAVVNQFKNKINYWEIGNEPNGGEFWAPISGSGQPAQADANEYVDVFLKTAWNVIKGPSGLDPDAKVILCAIAGNLANSRNYMSWMLTRGAKNYCDYLCWHDYNNPADEDPAEGGSDGRTRMQELYNILNNHGIGGRAIWMTEYGGTVPATGDPANGLKDQATKAMRYCMVGWAFDKMSGFPPLNFQRMFYYEMVTQDTTAPQTGALYNDAEWSRNPVFYGLQSMADKFGDNPIAVKRISFSGNADVYGLVFSNAVTQANWLALWSAEKFSNPKPSVQLMNGSSVVQRFPLLDRSPNFLKLTSPVNNYTLAAFTTPGGLSTATREAENIPVIRSSGEGFMAHDDAGASNDQFTIFESDEIGDFVIFWVNVPVAGTYKVEVIARRKNDRAKVELFRSTTFNDSATWTQIGTEKNMSNGSTTADYATLNFGNTALVQGNNAFMFVVSANGPAGSRISIDNIKLTQQ